MADITLEDNQETSADDDSDDSTMVDDGVGDSQTDPDGDEAKKILNMARYSLHPFVNDEESVMEIGKKKLDKLHEKREKKRQSVALLKEAVYGAHEAKLQKEIRIEERLEECLHYTDLETNEETVPLWLQQLRE